MPALNLVTYYEYFEAMASSIAAINHQPAARKKAFFDEDDFLTSKGTMAEFPCMMVEYPEIVPTAYGSENNRDIYNAAITIFVKHDRKDKKAKYAALDQSRSILRTVTSILRKDAANPQHAFNQMFDLENVQPLQQIEHRTEGIVGYRMLFELNTHLDLSMKPSELI